jgi:hypothetical protein
MKLSEFILLGENEKKHVVLHEGVLIGKRKSLYCMVFLFQINSYYVETYCDIRDKNVVEFRAFENTKPLAPYLESIRLDELLN